MTRTDAPRRQRTIVALAIAVVVVLVVGGAIVAAGAERGSAPPSQALPSPISVPTRVAELTPADDGRVTTWRVPEALVGLRDVAVADDGTVWVTEQNRAQIDSLIGDQLTRYEVASVFPDAGAFGLGWGPGDALWFTGYPGGTIGRVLPGGSINLFASRDAAATTLGIAEAADDAMWVTDPNLGAVLRIAPDGTLTTVQISKDGGTTQRPGFITAAGAGAMWFTIPDTSTIASVSTRDLHVARYTVPGHVTPRDIVATGDGRVWATLEDAPALVSVEQADGSVTVVKLRGPIPTDGVNDLAVAGDGTFWVTTPSSTVLHVDATGKILERVEIPDADYTDGVAISADGSVWVAARDDIIARIAP